MPPRPQTITLGEMRSAGVRGLLIYCGDYHSSHSIAVSADPWSDQLRLSDLEPRFVCEACGKKVPMSGRTFIGRGKPVPAMGYR
jgi:hypothetical protein